MMIWWWASIAINKMDYILISSYVYEWFSNFQIWRQQYLDLMLVIYLMRETFCGFLWGSIQRVKLWSWQCQLHVTLPHMPFSVICSCQPVILMLSIGPQYKITNSWSNHMIFGNIHLCIHLISIYLVAYLYTNMYTDNHKVSIYCSQLHKEKKK